MNARSRTILATSLLAMAALAGCSDEGATAPSPTSVTGTWVGRARVNAEFTPTFTLHLVESSDGSITGTGRLQTADPSVHADLTIGSGTNDFPSVNFAILNPDLGDVLFRGALAQGGGSMRGVLSGGRGTDSVPLGLVRQ